MAKELVSIILSCGVWGPYPARQRILFQCDNYSLVAAINEGSSKHPLVMHLLRCLWLFVALYDIDIVAEHIAGATNQVADMLSRNRSDHSFTIPTGIPTSHPTTTIATSHSVSPQARLDIQKLQGLLQRYYLSGLAPTTRNTYAASQ